MAVASRSKEADERVHFLSRGRRIPHRALDLLLPRVGLNNNSTLGAFSLPKSPWFAEADVVNYHMLHGGYFNFLALPGLTRKKPGIMTLHDMWAFTGHCVYSLDCERWKQGCGRCPHPNTYPAIKRDATRLERRLKQWAYDHAQLHVVTISTWIDRLARQSILGNLPIHLIPNGIDVDLFRPRDPVECRRLLRLPEDRRLILFAAADMKDRRKGGDLLLRALALLPSTVKKNAGLVIMGRADADLLAAAEVHTYRLGFIHDDLLKAVAYNAVDVFAFPTRADNLPLVLQESMASGTPMVSFAVGGVPDLVRHGETGFIAAPEDVEEFARHLERILTDDKVRSHLGRRCREVALAEYSIGLQAQRYRELFEAVRVSHDEHVTKGQV
jgi:glycosyltransferase involved in cell wall biosynthesis